MGINDGPLNLYRQIFLQMLSAGDKRLIQNDSKSYACVLIAELLKSATREALIFCNCLSLDMWCNADVLDGLKHAISSGVKIDVLLRSEPESRERNSAYNLLREKSNGIVSITSNKIVEENFVVIDSIAYRLEYDTQCHKGFACANDCENALILVHAFDNLKSASSQIV